MKADLHIHTTASDGSMTPTQVVKWAKKSGLEVIAVTDHDSVGGVAEAKTAGEALGIKVVTGIEVSTFSNCEIHILGYGFDFENPVFLQELGKMKDMRKERNAIIQRKLTERGVNLVMDVTADGVGRLNIAREMIKQNIARDVNDAFDRYLGPRGSVYTEVKRTAPLEAVKLIKKYGGISSIAHPRAFLLDKRLEMMVSGLKEFGLGGLEVFYPGHSDRDRGDLLSLTRKYGLIATGGSDFHGDEDKDFQVELPAATAAALRLN